MFARQYLSILIRLAKHKEMKIKYGLVLLLAVTTSVKATEIEITKISENTHVLNSIDYGTNIGVINGLDGLTLIDPMPGKEHLAELQKVIESISSKPIKYVINTHQHSDHTGGNDYFFKLGAKTPSRSEKNTVVQSHALVSHSSRDVVFFDTTSNVIFTGDIYDSSWHPTFYAGGISGFTKAINTIMAIGDQNTIVVPGHGKVKTKKELKVFFQNTLAWVNKIKQLHAIGMHAVEISSRDDVQKLVNRFNIEKKDNFVPQKALTRFVERTISVLKSGEQEINP